MKPGLQDSHDNRSTAGTDASVRWTGAELWRMLGHDLRNPLNGVQGFLDLLSDTNLDSEQREFVETALDCTECLRSILDGILECARIDSGQLFVSRQATNIRELVASVIHQHKREASSLGIVLRDQISADLPRLLSLDKGKLRQILTNLVGNAVKFTRTGSVIVQVERLRGELVFAVLDSGVGIPDSQISSVFDAFYQCYHVEGNRNRGVGLGLSIAKKLIETLGGTIAIVSREGSGTIVSFRLPCL